MFNKYENIREIINLCSDSIALNKENDLNTSIIFLKALSQC